MTEKVGQIMMDGGDVAVGWECYSKTAKEKIKRQREYTQKQSGRKEECKNELINSIWNDWQSGAYNFEGKTKCDQRFLTKQNSI